MTTLEGEEEAVVYSLPLTRSKLKQLQFTLRNEMISMIYTSHSSNFDAENTYNIIYRLIPIQISLDKALTELEEKDRMADKLYNTRTNRLNDLFNAKPKDEYEDKFAHVWGVEKEKDRDKEKPAKKAVGKKQK